MSINGENLSFMPEGYVAQRRRQRAMRLGIGLCAVVTLGVGAAFLVAERSLTQLRADDENITQQYEQAAIQIQQFEQLQQRQQELSRRARLAASLVEQMPRSSVVSEVRKLMPAGVTLMDVNLTSTPAPLPPPKAPSVVSATSVPPPTAGKPAKPAEADEPRPMEARIRIAGVAQTDPQVASFVEALNASRYFTDVSLLISQQSKLQGDAVRKFEVEVKLAAKLPDEAFEKRTSDPAAFSSAREER
jgi:Tfp pilus assembly protein PilN